MDSIDSKSLLVTKNRFGFLLMGRTYLYIGSALLLASMALPAFSDSHNEDILWGGAIWIFCAIGSLLRMGVIPFTIAATLCAFWNIPQLILTFVTTRESGTSLFTRLSFTIMSLVVLPYAAFFYRYISEYSTNDFRIGYYFYQAGFLFSTAGFWMRKRELSIAQRQSQPVHSEAGLNEENFQSTNPTPP